MQATRATIAIVASLLAIGCVILVSDNEPGEIVASGIAKPAAEKKKAVLSRRQDALVGKNLRDFKAYVEVNWDNIKEMGIQAGGEEAAVLEPLAAAIRNSHVEHLDKAWDGFYEKTMKKYKKKNSLARNMVRQIASKLRSNHGLLTVRGKKVSITGQTLGLRSTPDAEKKFLGAKLKKVLTMAKTLSVKKKKIVKKKKKPWLTINDQRDLWGSSCVDDEAFGEGYSMNCKEIPDKTTCHNRGGCKWQTGWDGK
jgi:hypothetical protein